MQFQQGNKRISPNENMHFVGVFFERWQKMVSYIKAKKIHEQTNISLLLYDTV